MARADKAVLLFHTHPTMLSIRDDLMYEITAGELELIWTSSGNVFQATPTMKAIVDRYFATMAADILAAACTLGVVVVAFRILDDGVTEVPFVPRWGTYEVEQYDRPGPYPRAYYVRFRRTEEDMRAPELIDQTNVRHPLVFDCFDASPLTNGVLTTKASAALPLQKFLFTLMHWARESEGTRCFPPIVTEEQVPRDIVNNSLDTDMYANVSYSQHREQDMFRRDAIAVLRTQLLDTNRDLQVAKKLIAGDQEIGQFPYDRLNASQHVPFWKQNTFELPPGRTLANMTMAQPRADLLDIHMLAREELGALFGVPEGLRTVSRSSGGDEFTLVWKRRMQRCATWWRGKIEFVLNCVYRELFGPVEARHVAVIFQDMMTNTPQQRFTEDDMRMEATKHYSTLRYRGQPQSLAVADYDTLRQMQMDGALSWTQFARLVGEMVGLDSRDEASEKPYPSHLWDRQMRLNTKPDSATSGTKVKKLSEVK
jgi:hypothetical protein